MVHLVFHKTCATEVFLVKLRCFCRVYKTAILVFSYPFLALKTRLSTRPTVGARMLPPKLYLVVFLSSVPGEPDKDNLFGLQKTLSLASGKLCCTISHVHTPWGNCNKCSSMVVSVKDSVS